MGGRVSKREKQVIEYKRMLIDRYDGEEAAKKREMSEDSKTRIEIQKYIISKFKEGKNREEVLNRTRFVYGGRKYAKYQPYFAIWVDHYKSKERSNEGEER